MANSETEYYTEAGIIRRAQAGDTDAFCELAERYARRIYLLAFHYCRNAQDAEDLSQEVWLKAYQALNGFRSEASFYTWLRRITINTFLNHQRSRSFLKQGQTTVVQYLAVDSIRTNIASEVASEKTIFNKVLFENVMNALAELSPSQRLIFLLRHYEGMSYDEIANAMNCSIGTAKKSVWRAIAKLRARLDVAGHASDEGLTELATEY
ncbi:MAG TPA: sigma-70 family RNA polymerase sigma factor [Pyrinomonadaceae bacterium]|nr:sigma-70 family RNA polymerase sigma factor [Pyrinomonadaceae bacterium]